MPEQVISTTKQIIGKVCVAPKGTYSGTTQYYALDLVSSGNASYIAKQDVKGVAPTASNGSTYWQEICTGGGGSPRLKTGDILTWEPA